MLLNLRRNFRDSGRIYERIYDRIYDLIFYENIRFFVSRFICLFCWHAMMLYEYVVLLLTVTRAQARSTTPEASLRVGPGGSWYTQACFTCRTTSLAKIRVWCGRTRRRRRALEILLKSSTAASTGIYRTVCMVHRRLV